MNRYITGIVFFILFSCPSFSQQKNEPEQTTTSAVIEELGYFWKLDSLANNGFRFYTYQKLLNSRIDKVTKELLFLKLGKPNEIRKNFNGVVEYVYHFFDQSKFPKDFDAPMSCRYLAFIFSEKSPTLVKIDEGDTDL